MVMPATVLLKAIRQCKPGWAELGAWTDEFALDSVACCAHSVKVRFHEIDIPRPKGWLASALPIGCFYQCVITS